MDDVIARLDARCRRAEEEYPKLAAPDGTVAVPFADLRHALNLLTRTNPDGLREALEEARDFLRSLVETDTIVLASTIEAEVAKIEGVLR